MLRTSLFTTALILMMSVPAMAQTKADAAMKSSNPYVQKAQDKAVEIAKTFTPVEIENLGIIKDAFGILGAVHVTSQSVDAAVKQCGKDNPDMKPDIDKQYGEWKGGVVAALDTKDKEMMAAINDGRFKKPKEVIAFLDLLQKAAQHSYDKMEKKIISTPSACDSLMDSMDDSSDKLGEMLAEMKFPYAVPKDVNTVTPPSAGARD